MSALNVVAEIEIAAEPTDVAGVMFDPAREPEWMAAVTSVEVIDPAIRPGARVKHAATVMGFAVGWTTTVESFHFPHMLTLRIAEGSFNGTVQYQVGRGGTGSIARVAIAGDAALPAMIPAAMVTGKAREALDGYLARLKVLVETPA
jgi:uncharacterized membrane protein